MRRKERLSEGQAMLEFALSLPILLFFILGIIDFAIALFAYAHASNVLRSALRQAEIIGYASEGGDPPFLDCNKIESIAGSGWFSSTHDMEISYIKANDRSTRYYCDTVSDGVIENGDILHLKMGVKVVLLFLPLGPIDLQFEGERSILRSIRVTPIDDSDSTGGDPMVPVPPAPLNFRAMVDDCSTGIVTFRWDWGTTSSLPTRAEIYDVADDTLVLEITGDMSRTICDGTCHDTIPVPGGSRIYYMVAYNGIGTDQKVSEHSTTTAVTCSSSDPILPTPPAPTNLVATCAAGIVSFTWNWGSISPMPTRAIIYDFDTMSPRVNITGIMDPPSCTGTCSDAVPAPGYRRYTIVAVNGTEPNEKYSPPSYPALANCPSETVTSVVEVKLRESRNTAACTWFNNYFGGRTVTLKNLDTLDEETLPTDAFGTVTFSGLAPGSYQLTLLPSFAEAPKTYQLVSEMEGGTCQALGSTTFNFTLSASQFRSFTFGYKED